MDKSGVFDFTRVLNIFSNLTGDPTSFLTAQTEKSDDAKELLRLLYRNAVVNDKLDIVKHGILPQLIYARFTEDQIWEQLELRNQVVFENLDKEIKQLVELPTENLVIRLKEDEDEEKLDKFQSDEVELSENESVDLEYVYSGSNVSPDSEEFSRKCTTSKSNPLKKKEEMKKQEEDSDEEMRKHLDKLDALGTEIPDDGIDYFAEINDDELDEKDEFGSGEESDDRSENGEIKNDRFEADFHSGTDSENEKNYDFDSEDACISTVSKPIDEPKSSYELRAERLNKCIADFEDELLSEKPWQLKGEIQAFQRPFNALIEEHVEFESTIRPAPVNDEQVTETLEQLIKQRIKDQAWDDVQQKVEVVPTPQQRRKEIALDQEKPQESLAQIYEKDYQNALAKLDPNYESNDPDEPKEHKEIRLLIKTLFAELDALSNFHFAPKAVAPEPKIITNTPAIAMEEVAPIAINDANLLAPKEVFRGPKNEVVGKSERTKTDKNRERRKKKQKARAINHVIEEREKRRLRENKPPSKKVEHVQALKKVTKQRNATTITTNNDASALKTSKAFFAKLQDTAKSGAAAKISQRKRNADSKKNNVNAKRVKL